MKKTALLFCLVFYGVLAYAQNGLENIIVEKYYVSNAADSIAADADATSAGYAIGALPTGSVTYRVYADMLPGYNFQAVYGVPTHTCEITTSTSFYNNSAGSSIPAWNRTAVRNTTGNVLGLDSYFSGGGAASNAYGIPKADDVVATGGANLITLVSGNVLQNADASAGIPLTTQDGYYYSGAPTGLPAPGAVTFTTGLDASVFNDGSTIGNSFINTTGSIYVAGGATGPIPATNRVLIGQFTTNGVFSFHLNVQIGGPGGSVQNYVSSNPVVGKEFSIPGLNYPVQNLYPTVDITAPANGVEFHDGDVISIAATAADVDGTIASVEFFVDNISVGVDNTAPYSVTYTCVATGATHLLKAVATDNQNAQTTSAQVFISVAFNINTPPTVSITTPSTGSSYAMGGIVNIVATANDKDGTIASVEIFLDGVSVRKDSSYPYEATYTCVVGTHTLTAVATDNQQAQTTSAPVVISVSTNLGPTVSITAPLDGSSYTEKEVANITATANDPDGTVASVEFFVDGVSVGLDNTAPYAATYTCVTGAHTLTAIATDNQNAKKTSAPVAITVLSTVSVNELNVSGVLFTMYPNPSKDLFTMEIISGQNTSYSYYTVYNIEGKVIFRKTLEVVSGKQVESIDMSSYKNGEYIVELSINGITSSKKIIKN